MSDLLDIGPENEDSNPSEIEPPVDGPTPDWMQTASASQGSSFDADDAPEWLKNIRAGKGTPAEPEPEEAEAEAPKAAEPDDSTFDLARLLAEEGISLDEVEDERPAEAAGMSVKEWMIATSDDELIRKRIGAEDEAPSEAEAPPETPPEPVAAPPAATTDDVDKLVASDELPDWLQDVADEEAAPEPFDMSGAFAEAPSAEPAGDMPAWLLDISDEADRPEQAEPLPVGDKAVDDMPDWLQELSVDDVETAPEAELPDWLQGVGDEDVTEEPVAGEAVEQDWLAEIAEEPVTAGDEVADKFLVSDDLPDWLREVEEESAILADLSSAPSAGFTAGEQDLPDWLHDVESVTTGDEKPLPLELEPEPVDSVLRSVSDEVELDEEDLPDWLRAVQEEDTGVDSIFEPDDLDEISAVEDIDSIGQEELPDWLQEMEAEAEAEAEIEAEAAEELVVEEELPDWLQEMEAEAEAEAEEAVEAEAEAEAEIEAEAAEEWVAEEELPDWLQEMEAEAEAAEAEAEAEVEAEEELIAEEELPDWLQEMEAEAEAEEAVEAKAEAEAEIEAETAEELEAEAEVEAEEELIAEEELPDWLQEMEEAVEAEAEFEAEAEAEAEAEVEAEEELIAEEELEAVAEAEAIWREAEDVEELVAAEVAPEPEPAPVGLTGLPDWLQKLRQGDVDEAEVAPPEPAVVAEAVPEPAKAEVAKTRPEPAVKIPDEADERLRLARQARDNSQIEQAIQYYDSLVASSLYLDEVIDDLQQMIKFHPGNPMLFQVMGDAMMKDGRLQSALDAYRQALAVL